MGKQEDAGNGNNLKTIWNPFKKGFWAKDNLLGHNNIKHQQEVTSEGRPIKETKNTCQACGNVWYYGKEDVRQNRADKMENTGTSMQDMGKSMMCCGGCIPALFIPTKQTKEVRDLNKCNKCGSGAVEKEEVVHYVK